ncbi:MAG: TIGR04283 family arsenosugar biosynthesis glycosyltransferase [Gammaproteobacteria bacterium]|nr:TIGR04283 family arsenosugar biosynthesis glycosyltransferase [Gammaproteobacteria bacterium]
MKVSIVIPTYNEAANIEATLRGLQQWRQQGHEIIVVDGGSDDGTVALASPHADMAFVGPKGRARQMNTGASKASGDIILFLHADTQLPNHAVNIVCNGLEQTGRNWGRFDVRLSGSHWLLRIVEMLMNIRSRFSGIATGDQAIFVRRSLFQQLKGYAEIPLMEDIELSRRLKRISRPYCISQALTTSSRRWERRGIARTILLMWRLRLAYFLGVSPERLARQYL